MKLKDLLKGRDNLRKYDEMREWRGKFAYMVDMPTWNCLIGMVPSRNIVALPLPDHIKQIILDALDAELKKMEEE